jgi:hypothetical protein
MISVGRESAKTSLDKAHLSQGRRTKNRFGKVWEKMVLGIRM